MSAVLCVPACLCVSTAASRGQAPPGERFKFGGALRGKGGVNMGRRWRVWWRPGERERGGRGPGGSWWRLGERERR